MLFKKIIGGLAVALAIFALGSCAAIIHGSKQSVRFQSSPDGAVVEVQDVLGTSYGSCITPCSLELKRKKEYKVTIVKSGYTPVSLTIDRKTDGWIWGNLLFGGLIGLIVDFSGGAAYKLSPDELTTTLTPASRGMFTPNNFDQGQGLVVLDYDKLSPLEKEKLATFKPIPLSQL